MASTSAQELAATARRIAGWLGTEVIDRRGTPGGDTDGYYVPTRRDRYLILVSSPRGVRLVREGLAPPEGRWVTAGSEPPDAARTDGADDDETYVTLTPAGAIVAYSSMYRDDAAIRVRIPDECCRLFLGLERSLERRLSLLIERYLGATIGLLRAADRAELEAELDAASSVLAAVA